MTIVKDEAVATAEEVLVPNESAGAEDSQELDIMTGSKLPDDWSIIGSSK